MFTSVLPGHGCLRVSIFVNLPALLREFGQDPGEIIAAAGFDPSLFDDPDSVVPYLEMSHLLKACVDRTGCEHFGLLLGQRGQASDLGLVGHLVQNSPDVGAALRNLILHLHLHDQGGVPTLAEHDGVVALGYAIYQKGVVRADAIYDASIAVALNIMRALCGPRWRPTEVLFSHAKPADVRPYRRFFQAPLCFDACETALVFPSTWLDHPLTGSDPDLRRMLKARVEAVEASGNGELVPRLRRILRNVLCGGTGSVGQVSEFLSMHRRTLNRRLRAHGTTLKALAEDIRFEIARQLLEDTGVSVMEIATMLDYADRSAFTRAFKRWSGTTPAAWRSQAGRREHGK